MSQRSPGRTRSRLLTRALGANAAFSGASGSVLLLAGFPDLLTPAGEATVAAVAVVVAGLGGGQLAGLRRRGPD